PDVVGPAAGVHYQEFTSLRAPIPVVGDGMAVSAGASGLWWADHLLVDDADVLARYEHPQLGRFPAVTTRAHGLGRVTYVGTVPDRTLGADLVRHLVPTPVAAAWRRDTPVTVHSGVANGTRIHFVHNWSGEAAQAVTPHGVDDLVAGVPLPPDHTLTLEPWGSLVLADTAPHTDPVRQQSTERKVGQ
ncbi:MAG: beta-galactosidase trimerization domain-containing protein, partial [Propionicimonas sp.]